jgi:hypothetical protein
VIRVTVKKGDVSMIDLAALTAKEQVEFAMFTRGSERLIAPPFRKWPSRDIGDGIMRPLAASVSGEARVIKIC